GPRPRYCGRNPRRRPPAALRAAGRRQDHLHPRARPRTAGARPRDVADLRYWPHPSQPRRRPRPGPRGRLPAQRPRRTRRPRPGSGNGGVGHRRRMGDGNRGVAQRRPPGDQHRPARRRHADRADPPHRRPLVRHTDRTRRGQTRIGWSTVLLLAFDTATPAVTTALCESGPDGVRVRAARTTVDARRHGELLTPQIRTVVADAGVDLEDVTHIAVGIGPGPYTRLRVDLAPAHALAEPLGVRCGGVASRDAHAWASGRTTAVNAPTDARRKEVFWARYTDAASRVGDIAVTRPADVDTAGLPVI